MSDFHRAFKRTLEHEGGVNYNPKDRGNVVVSGVVTIPTYKGIAPAKHPGWPGFRYIKGCTDQMTKMPVFGTGAYYVWAKYLDRNLAQMNVLQALVEAFYLDNFWQNLGGIDDQRVAEEVFDKAVNCGRIAFHWLQRAVGVHDDGIIGPITIAAVNATDPVAALSGFNVIARKYYQAIVEHDPSQGQFLDGWLARLRGYDDSKSA